jgi:ribosome biogenesis GTPase A
MVAFWEKVKRVILKSDFVIEVVDARFPMDSRNFELERFTQECGKVLMIIINKSDLVPEEFAKKATELISKDAVTIYLSSKQRHGIRALFDTIHKLRPVKRVKIGVVGYPNTGKSMIINLLKGKHSANTGAMPGVTRGEQTYKAAGHIKLIDTPGVVPIKGKKSAFLRGAVDISQVKDVQRSVHELLSEFIEKGVAGMVEQKYGIPLNNPVEFLELFAKKYNYLLKGGLFDMERAARKVYQDWICGSLKVYWL